MRFTIVTGFRPTTRGQDVTRLGSTTLEDASVAARVVDASEMGPSNDVTTDKLTKTVEVRAIELQQIRR